MSYRDNKLYSCYLMIGMLIRMYIVKGRYDMYTDICIYAEKWRVKR